MQYQGICQKMRAELDETVETEDGRLAAGVAYSLVLDPFECKLSPLLGQSVQLEWSGAIRCLSCGAATKKSYAQGHCYKCMITKASCDMCMMKPETCHFHLGTCREPDWALQVCFNPHIVYLANSSALKVGITRQVNMPTRWLDQGATQALPIVQTANRFLCGVIEKLFAQELADKTDWRAMLRGESTPIDLLQIRDELLARFMPEIERLQHAYPNEIKLLPAEMVMRQFAYPVLEYPKKVTAHNFDKQPLIAGTLLGIKGQYLMLDTGVLNLRKFGGYQLMVSG